MKQLTSSETEELACLVLNVNRCLTDAGNSWRSAIKYAESIRDKELWRQSSPTWSQFCEKQGWNRNRLNQLFHSDAFLLAISETAVTTVTTDVSERAVRELKKSPVVKAAAVLNELQATNTPVTAKAIKKVAQELSEEEQAKQDALSYLSHQAKGDLPSIPDQVPDSPVVDCMGFPIPKGIVAYYERARTEFRELMNTLSKVKCQIEKAQAAEDPLYLMLGQTLAGDINSIRWNIKRKLPHTVCTQCNGYPLVNGSCELCSSTGFNFEEEQTSNPWIGDVLKVRAAGIAKKQQNA